VVYCGKESVYVSGEQVGQFCVWWEVSISSFQFETRDPYVEFYKPLILVDWISSPCAWTHSALLCSFLCQLVEFLFPCGLLEIQCHRFLLSHVRYQRSWFLQHTSLSSKFTKCLNSWEVAYQKPLHNILLSHRATPVCVNECYVCPAIFIVFKMSNFHEQRICVKFCVKLGKPFMEMFEMLKTAFGN
jgi:hypothetical protein